MSFLTARQVKQQTSALLRGVLPPRCALRSSSLACFRDWLNTCSLAVRVYDEDLQPLCQKVMERKRETSVVERGRVWCRKRRHYLSKPKGKPWLTNRVTAASPLRRIFVFCNKASKLPFLLGCMCVSTFAPFGRVQACAVRFESIGMTFFVQVQR